MNINLKEKNKKIYLSFCFQRSGINKTNYHKKRLMPAFISLFLVIIFLAVPTGEVQALDPLGFVGGLLPKVDIVSALLSSLFVIIYNIGNFALNVAGQLVRFGAWLIDVMMDQSLYTSVLVNSSAIRVGWETIRDFCNMFFIFFLLIVAFATILRISEYSAKTILPKFLIAIFMINFSMEITKLVIDFGQVFMYEIRGWMGDFSGTTGGGRSLTSIVDYFNEYFNASLSATTVDSAVAVLFAAAYSFMLGFTYIMMAGFLLIRLLMFAVLMILSPFAFFCNIFPGTRRYASEWWGSIIKYSLFGPIFIFFVFISATMAFELTSSFNPSAVVPAGYDQIEAIKGLLPKLIPNIIALMMLWMAIPVTQKLGIAGSSRLIGGTLGLGTVAMASYGATKLAGGWGKKAAGGAAGIGERYAASRFPGAEKIRTGTKTATDWLKTKPIVGNIMIKHESEKAKEKEKDSQKHEDIMKTLSGKDRKAYVDNILDPKAKAAAQQAHFNLLAKDSGKGLTNNALKDIDIDEAELKKRYKLAKIYGHDTEKLEMYRPDLIEGKDAADTQKEREKQIQKVVADGNYKNIKSSALMEDSGVIEKELRKQIGDIEFEKYLQNKPQVEKDELATHYEEKLGRNWGALLPDDRKKEQQKVALLAGSGEKLNKMHEITGVDINNKIIYHATNVDKTVTKNVVDQMSNSEILKQGKAFFDATGHMISESAIKEMGKYGQNDKINAILAKSRIELGRIPGTAGTTPHPDLPDLTRTKLNKKIKTATDQL